MNTMLKKTIAAALCLTLCLMLTACGGGQKAPANVALGDVLAKFNLDGEMMSLTQDDLTDLYGIEAADVKQFAASINGSGIKADEIVLIEAVDAAAAARVKEALDARLQNKLNELENYLPEEYAVAKACSVQSAGNFVAMIVAPNAADLVKLYGESVK